MPFFFKPFRIAAKTDYLPVVNHVAVTFSPYKVDSVLFMCGRKSVLLPGGNFISLKLLIGAGMPSPSTRM